MMNVVNRILGELGRRGDILFASLFVLVVCMLILPLPTQLVDLLLALNLSFSLLILVAVTYLRSTLDLSTFPTILLLTTVFRLALTVSTARLILAHGDAGLVIKGFGNFVVAGNVVVGLVIFIIIAIVQFIVITKGAERVAEVSARFTLDSMPGKQMSIDSDFRNGEITKEEARRRRFHLERESQFFGAMDGAMRFVKGDAIASMLVVFVNLIGGLLIGMFQRGMKFGEAGKLYSLLTVGDGLVAQIPAMLLAVAAGAIVTRVITEESSNLSTDLTRQLSREPKAIGIASVVVGLLSFVPGFPTLTFIALGALLGFSAWMVSRRAAAPPVATVKDGPAPPAAPVLRNAGFGDVFCVKIAPGPLARLAALGLAEKLEARRNGLIHAIGYRIPAIGFEPREGLGLDAILDVDGVPAARVPVLADPSDADTATFADQLTMLQRRHVGRAFGVQEAAQWLETLQPKLGRLTADVAQVVPLLRVVEVVRRLLDEDLTLAQPRIVLEALIQHAGKETDPDVINEHVRAALKRQICFTFAGADGSIPVIIAGADVEDYFRRAGAPGAAASPADQRASTLIVEQMHRILGDAIKQNLRPVVLSSLECRRVLRMVLLTHNIRVPVLSYAELAGEFTARPIAALSLAAPQVVSAHAA